MKETVPVLMELKVVFTQGSLMQGGGREGHSQVPVASEREIPEVRLSN